MDAIRYVLDTGCKWRALPRDFPPWRTCYGFMARWAAAGVVGQIRGQLRKRIRREMGRSPRAVATVIDSQSVKAADTVGRESRGYDGAKKINGRKRHLVVDTKGLPLFVMVTPADMTDRDAAKEVLFRLLPAEEHTRIRHPAPPLGRRAPAGLDDERPSARTRLRTPGPALRNAHHLGRNHPHGQTPHTTEGRRVNASLTLGPHQSPAETNTMHAHPPRRR